MGAQTRAVTKAGVEFTVVAGERPTHDEFWDWYASPGWEPETVAAYRLFARPGARIADIGAWIGPTTLLGAGLGADVVAVEPDPVAADVLRANLALNPALAARVTVVEAALTVDDGTTLLVAEGEGGESLSHLGSVRPEAGAAWEVRALSIGSFLDLPELDGVEFVKIDAEAAEYTIVPAMQAFIAAARPAIFVATHPNVLYDRRTLRTRLSSGLAAVVANRRLLRALSTYRHHYVWAGDRWIDRRRTNVARSLAPLPLRASLLVGATLFTDRIVE
jgi:FkbM family methyltransferase